MRILPDNRLWFPDPRSASKSETLDGLVAVGGDLSVERLLLSYRSGIFPWTIDPITWWSPDPRAIIELDQFHVSRSLAKTLRTCSADFQNESVAANVRSTPRQGTGHGDHDPGQQVGRVTPCAPQSCQRYPDGAHGVTRPTLRFTDERTDPGTSGQKNFSITKDRAFRQVMEHCAAEHHDGTWISPEFIEAYTRLHQAGHAHSVECWQDKELIGGIYGVSIGTFFAAESMFYRTSNASKVALYFLIEHLRRRGFLLFDIQMLTPITRQLGGRTILREEYLKRLALATQRAVFF